MELVRKALRWARRREVDDAYIETHEMLIRFARRCAYDFSHAANMLSERDRELFGGKPELWIKLFQSGNKVKDYRLDILRDLDEAERKLDKFVALCAERGIEQDIHHPDIPF